MPFYSLCFIDVARISNSSTAKAHVCILTTHLYTPGALGNLFGKEWPLNETVLVKTQNNILKIEPKIQ